MLKFCTAFCCYQIIPPVMIENIRTFRCSFITALQHIINRANLFFCLRILLLYTYATEALMIQSVVKKHIDQPFGSIRIMEERRVKPHCIKGDWIRPWTFWIRSSYHKIMSIFKTLPVGVYYCIDQVESTIIICKIGRPYTAGRLPSFSLLIRLTIPSWLRSV